MEMNKELQELKLKLKLEKEGMEKVTKILTNNNVTSENIINIMKSGQEEFVKQTGRPMTYSEMREMYG